MTALNPNSNDYRFYELSFGKRPAEELYDINTDNGCIKNLANDPTYAELKTKLWQQLQAELVQQQDPRILGQGDIFDYYPNSKVERQQKLYGKPNYAPVAAYQAYLESKVKE